MLLLYKNNPKGRLYHLASARGGTECGCKSRGRWQLTDTRMDPKWREKLCLRCLMKLEAIERQKVVRL